VANVVLFIIAGLALVMTSAIHFICRGHKDFFLDQKHAEKDSSLDVLLDLGRFMLQSQSQKNKV
jgi:hypothetical protein